MFLSIHGAHDSSITFIDKNNTIRIFELERFCKKKSAALSSIFENTFDMITNEELISVFDIIKNESKHDNFSVCYYNQLFKTEFELLSKEFGITNFIKSSHHRGHAQCAFYQSPFNESLIFSFDGGGHDENDQISYFNIYKASKRNKTLEHVDQIDINFGTAYALFGTPISEIYKNKNLNVYSGKLMGLSAYGDVIHDWIDPIIKFYTHLNLTTLSNDINIRLDTNNVSGQTSYNLAKTSQYVFEKLFMDIFKRFYKDIHLPICMTGGCALNVLNNNKIKNMVGPSNLFIPPNPNDSGLSMGYAIDNVDDLKKSHHIKFNGMDLQNRYILNSMNGQKVTYERIISLLLEGKIIAIAKGFSESGPRALGNRSIICYPTSMYIKNKLNSSIKFREWFRPFAPVVKKEDVGRFFNDTGEFEFMSYCPTIKNEYKNIFPAIIHVDDSCRLQSVDKTDGILYEILNYMDDHNILPLLLNTSFNTKGKPMVNDINDILKEFYSSDLDALIIENSIYLK